MRAMNVRCTVQGNSFNIYNEYNQVWLWKSANNNVIIYASLFNSSSIFVHLTLVIADIQVSLSIYEYNICVSTWFVQYNQSRDDYWYVC